MHQVPTILGNMSRVVLMCGPAGSGKSTVARKLQSEGFTRLSIDEEAWSRGYRMHPLPEEIARDVEDDLQRQLVCLVKDGLNVVLDYSFWSRAKRSEYRNLLEPLGVIPETFYLATPRNIVLDRVRARDGIVPNEVKLSEETASDYYDGLEPPTMDAGPLQIIR